MKQMDEVQQYKYFVTAEVLFLLDYVAPKGMQKKIMNLACQCYDKLPDKITLTIREDE